MWGRGRPSWQHRRSEIASLLPRSPKFPRERGGRAKHSRLQSFYFQAFVAKESVLDLSHRRKRTLEVLGVLVYLLLFPSPSLSFFLQRSIRFLI